MISAKQMARVLAKTKRILGRDHPMTTEVKVRLAQAARRQLKISPKANLLYAWRVGPTELVLVTHQLVESGHEEGKTYRTIIWYDYVRNACELKVALLQEHRDLVEPDVIPQILPAP